MLPAYGDSHVNVVISNGTAASESPLPATQNTTQRTGKSAGKNTGERNSEHRTATRKAQHAPNETAVASQPPAPVMSAQDSPELSRQPETAATPAFATATPTGRNNPANTTESQTTTPQTTGTATAEPAIPLANSLPTGEPAAGRQQADRLAQEQRAASEHRRFIIGRIENLLSRNLVYPRLAQRRGWEGEVMLSFRLQADGRIENISVTKTSGYVLLDAAAEKGLRSLHHIDDAASWLQGQAMELEIPVLYKLTEG